jgi:hypothetical protein
VVKGEEKERKGAEKEENGERGKLVLYQWRVPFHHAMAAIEDHHDKDPAE